VIARLSGTFASASEARRARAAIREGAPAVALGPLNGRTLELTVRTTSIASARDLLDAILATLRGNGPPG
jgi:hypothetical protein